MDGSRLIFGFGQGFSMRITPDINRRGLRASVHHRNENRIFGIGRQAMTHDGKIDLGLDGGRIFHTAGIAALVAKCPDGSN